ncbi:tetratricopeptide repeat protein [Candidatus Fermentibacterales bacterium]|nr:tetratricopeptide repeat protein [Candidatus Fermentibacterales bacterium]
MPLLRSAALMTTVAVLPGLALPVWVETRDPDGRPLELDREYIITLPGEQGLGEGTDILLMAVEGADTSLVARGWFGQMYNAAKSWALLFPERDSLEVCFQMPGTAFYTEAAYRVDASGDTLILLSESSGDPSWDAMGRIDSLLPAGRIEEAASELWSMMYPHHYYRPEVMGMGFLEAAWTAAIAAHRQGTGNAIQAFDQAGEVLDMLFWEAPWWAASGPDGWCLRDLMDWDHYVEMVNDYGFFLHRAGRLGQAIRVLRRVTEIAPDRVPVYLNLADALWDAGEREEAAALYAEYVRKLTAPGTSVLIPPRALERSGGD